MSTPRFSIVLGGRILDQHADGTWTMTDKPESFGYLSHAEMAADFGEAPPAEPLEQFGDGSLGEAIAEVILALVTQLPAYRATLTDIGGLMLPIVNQSWCPNADKHQPHIQCQECLR